MSPTLFRDAEAAIEGVGHAPEQGLHLLIGSDSLQSLLAAKTPFLESAKRRRSGELLIRIDPNHAGFERPSYSPGALVIRSPNAGGEAEQGVIGLLYQVF